MIVKKGKRINYLQEQKKVKITTTIQKPDYQDIKVTGNQEDIEKTIHSIRKIVLCKIVPTNNCQFRIDCKFEQKQTTNNTQKNYQTNQITTDQLTQIINHQTTQKLI